MPRGFEAGRQRPVFEQKTRHFLADAQAFATTIEIRVEDAQDKSRPHQSFLIFSITRVVETPLTKGNDKVFPP